MDEYIRKLQLHQHSLLTRKVFSRQNLSAQVLFSVSSGSSMSSCHLHLQVTSSSCYLHIQVIFIFKSSSSSSHIHCQVIFIKYGSSLVHHLIWIVTAGSSSSLDHRLIWIVTARSSSILDHHLI